MADILPRFPVRLTFNPELYPLWRQAWRHNVARNLILLWAPKHLINQNFWDEALAVAEIIDEKQPKTPEELVKCFWYWTSRVGTNFSDRDVAAFAAEALPFLTGGQEVPFEVILTKE